MATLIKPKSTSVLNYSAPIVPEVQPPTSAPLIAAMPVPPAPTRSVRLLADVAEETRIRLATEEAALLAAAPDAALNFRPEPLDQETNGSDNWSPSPQLAVD